MIIVPVHYLTFLANIALYAGSVLEKTTERIDIVVGIRPIAQLPNVHSFSEPLVAGLRIAYL